jgi:hypothetical protein
MNGREEGTVTRKNGKETKIKAIARMSKDEADAKVQEILSKRKEKKATKAARPSVGAAGKSSKVLNFERMLADEDVHWQEYVNAQVKARQPVDEQKQAEYKDNKALLMSKMKRAELNPVQGAGNASGKKRKNRVKVPLSGREAATHGYCIQTHTKCTLCVE